MPSTDRKALQQKILQEKRARDILILAHSYQSPDILEIADIVGDSYALSVAAAKVEQPTVLMCGVRFMAETVKILSPEKRVLLSDARATCQMAEQITKEEVLAYKAAHPDCCVVAYINTTADVKSVCDVCVTSSSALRIVSALPERDIFFLPDRNLGAYIAAQLPEKNITLFEGCCPVHHFVEPEDVMEARRAHPDAVVAVHPECRPEVVALCDFVGSTSAIIDYAVKSDKPVIIATERGVCDMLQRKYPDRAFYQLCEKTLVCNNMKYTSLAGVYRALTGEGGCEITLPEALRLAAKRPIDNMLRYGG